MGRNQEAERLIEDTKHEAITMLSRHLPPETMRAIELAAGRGLEAYYSRVSPS